MIRADIQQIKQRFGIIGNDPALNRSIDVALQIAPTDLSVLITGESGVGKESFPQIIHQNSQRKHGQYIAVNCGAIPEGTIDSELFGHEKGSFTGALADRKGYFEVADGGTIFLDEVGELPMPTQARLLRVLESGEFIRVGSSKVQKTNVRIIAATNVNLLKAIRDGKFREDLYYRLNTVPIQLTPLRDRPDDILLLFRKFAGDFAEKYRMPVIRLTEDAKPVLVAYRWPGNIRELKNVTERISVIETNRDIDAAILKGYLPNADISQFPALLRKEDDQKVFGSEREILYQVLFDMRKDVNDLKKLVRDIMDENAEKVPSYADPAIAVVQPTTAVAPYVSPRVSAIHEAAEDVEETLSLEEVEREMIRKALERHAGKRKNAAQDLKISERTLYRKIKEYNLE
ncbi:MAG: sigma 54-interacting transcriptional regulator [Bacteroidales bacterium]|nr:sigma 54-interacting transcriptional regulator [Bacteroidales bacterium]